MRGKRWEEKLELWHLNLTQGKKKDCSICNPCTPTTSRLIRFAGSNGVSVCSVLVSSATYMEALLPPLLPVAQEVVA